MKLKVPEKRGGAYIPCPAGTHNAVCVDCIELKNVERSYGGKTWTEDQVRFVFQIEKRMTEVDIRAKLKAWPDASDEQIAETKKLAGQRFTVRTFGMKQSMDPKAKLRGLVEGWLNKSFVVGEDFDPESLVGEPCFLTVIHKPDANNTGVVYANIGSVAPIMLDSESGQPLKAPIAPENYERAGQAQHESAPESDEDIPFD